MMKDQNHSFFNQYRTTFSPHLRIKPLIHYLIWMVRGVQVFALVGKSGTGKSFRAKLIAHKYGIDLIVDDGLLIRGQKILAGRSAKHEATKLSAFRTALFLDDSHAKEVITAIEQEKFKRMLIIATSEKMAQKIAQRLELPLPHRVIKIEDVSTKDEMQIAWRSRNLEGKHVIPVPAVEVRKNYPRIFFQSILILLEKRILKKKGRVFEKSIVRPQYDEKGEITVSDEVLSQMVYHCVKEFNELYKVGKVFVIQKRSGYDVKVIIEVPFGTEIADKIYNLQEYIAESIERFAGIRLNRVDITVQRLKDVK